MKYRIEFLEIENTTEDVVVLLYYPINKDVIVADAKSRAIQTLRESGYLLGRMAIVTDGTPKAGDLSYDIYTKTIMTLTDEEVAEINEYKGMDSQVHVIGLLPTEIYIHNRIREGELMNLQFETADGKVHLYYNEYGIFNDRPRVSEVHEG